MESCDTNILLYYLNSECAEHPSARAYLESKINDSGFALCELVLVELYVLLRNPAVVSKPLSAKEAVDTIQIFKSNPVWALLDYPGGLMPAVWRYAAAPGISRSAVFDARLALTLKHYGVQIFATHNPRHFQGYGFQQVIDPITAQAEPA